MESKLIVGLGNPGKEYQDTRHNLGFLVVRRLAEKLDVDFKSSSFTNGLVAKTECQGTCVYLLLPLTFMNRCGLAIKPMVNKMEMDFSNILVVCDDFNLGFGQIRLRSEGSDGGHNGLKSTIEHLGVKDFPRLRCGIGEPHKNKDVADYVLEKFSKEEKNKLDEFIEEASECCLMWSQEGTLKAMEKYNRRKEN